jgi:hypothetical protein
MLAIALHGSAAFAVMDMDVSDESLPTASLMKESKSQSLKDCR